LNATEQTRTFFNRLAEDWDQNCEHDPKKLSAIVTLANIQKGSRVVDIGCGTGILFNDILTREPSELLGIDLSDRMVAVAKGKFHNNSLRLLAADLFDTTETDFDIATIYNTYPHFPDKQKLAGKVADMLVPGGRIMIAHSKSKEMINARHQGPEVSKMSTALLPAERESASLTEFFNIDTLVDTPEMYIISGVKK
jgi:Predicted methyltransferase (contains TPR repeat)